VSARQSRALGKDFKQRLGARSVPALPGGCLEGDEAAFTIDDGVDLGRTAAARAADCLNFGPPFPPAAERWAVALVESIIWTSPGLTSTRALNNRRTARHLLAEQR
jgi:hypothetical protein